MIILRIPGTPAPKGSSRAILRGGHAVNVPSGSDTNKARLADWKADVSVACWRAVPGSVELADDKTGPVAVGCLFAFPMRKADVRKSGSPMLRAPLLLTVRPDVDKLVRSTLDAITSSGCIWRDDSQAIVLAARVYIPPGHPIESVVIIGDDVHAVTAEWQHELLKAGDRMRIAKEAA